LSVLIQQTWLQFNDKTDNLKQTYEKFEDTKGLTIQWLKEKEQKDT
jgi:hypothetical protein